jgi:MFS family permease
MVMITLVMSVGAAGRGAGINFTFLSPHFVNDLGLSVALSGLLLSTMQFGGIGGPLLFGWLSDRFSRRWVLQASLMLTGLGTLWIAFLGADLVLLAVSMLVYGMVSHSRLTLTQALVADTLDDRDRDAAFSVFYFVGFVSGPLWTILAGTLMDSFGFSVGFSAVALSYVLGSVLMFLVEEPRREYRTTATR